MAKKTIMTCSSGKACYKNEQAAKSELAFCKLANLNGNEEFQQIRYYKCNQCKWYHLTSKDKKTKHTPNGDHIDRSYESPMQDWAETSEDF